MRGGISYITKIDNKANNKYMKLHDYSKPSKYITYLDIQIICIVGQWVNNFLTVDLNGQIKKRLTGLM